KLDISVYYDAESKLNVLANTTVVNEEDGVYSFTVGRTTTVKVTGLETEESFISRKGGGKGTRKEPYIIERPVDLYQMADLVNDSFYNGRYALAYYRLNADIDMEGEQLFIIGDGTSSLAAFSGHFNGNNHKISNYYISDVIIEQSGFTDVFMPYIGLFGIAAANSSGAAEISNLTLENFTINANADRYDSMLAAGGVVGNGVGVNITNCSVSGAITADADDLYYGYIGGVVGYLQSYYDGENRVTSSVAGCFSDVTLEGQSGYLYAAGGIAGYVNAYEEQTPSYIVNSYYNGNVSGAMNAGGIAGYLTPYSSVKNCYSLGNVDAHNSISPQAGYEEYAFAYAGGIAGYVEHDGVVSGCFSLADAYASADSAKYEMAGAICGGLYSGEKGESIAASPALALNCTSEASDINKNYITQTLGWTEAEWSFDGEYPTFKGVDGTADISVTVKLLNASGATVNTSTANLSASIYLPVTSWYGNGLDEFVTSGALRSFGYYFDEQLTQKVPNGYVLTGEETLYCGLADYQTVSGVYYIKTDVSGSGVYVELKADGTLVYRNGGFNLTTTYIYDGANLTLYGCPAFMVADSTGNSYYTSAVGTLDGNVITFEYNVPAENAAGGSAGYSSETLSAVKKIENFLYGEYYSVSGGAADCVFNTDGTGTYSGSPMTYTVSGSTITINGTVTGAISGRTITISGTAYTAYDPFKGTWEKSAATHEEFTFDGKNAWSYLYYQYVDGVKTAIATASGTYTSDSEETTLTLTVVQNNGSGLAGNVIVSFDKEGCLQIQRTDYTQSYFKPLSLVGKWRYFYRDEAIEITFKGIGADGYGEATVFYETLNEDVIATYDVQDVQGAKYVVLYLNDTVMGVLHYDEAAFTLKGMIYSYSEDTMLDSYIVYDLDVYADTGELVVVATYEDIVTFCLYDEFGGEWMSSEWGLVTFNGYGSYNLNSIIIREERNKVLTLPVSGTVKIQGISGKYKLDNSTMTGTLDYKGASYKIAYNYADDTVTAGTYTLYRRDGLKNIALEDENGVVYTFDGGSAHPDGGNVETSNGGSYKYTLDGATIKITGLGDITVSNDRYVLGGKTLKIVNGFTGNWLVGGTLDGMEIGEIGVSGLTKGTYLGVQTDFNYDAAAGNMSFEYKGGKYYLYAMTAKGGTYELVLTTNSDLETASDIVNCIGASVQPDSFRGKYTASNGDYVIFDGLSVSEYGNGTVVWYLDGETETYSYTVNRFGMLSFIYEKDDDGRNIYYIAVEENEESAGIHLYKGNGTSYTIYEADRLYNVSATNEYEQSCAFDGLGTVICGDKTYEYIIEERDELNLLYKLMLIDGEGHHAAELNYGSSEYKLRFVDDLTDITVLVGDISYSFTSAGNISATDISAEEPTVTAYTYVIKSVNKDTKTYTLTVTDGTKTYEGVLVCDENGQYTLKLTEIV
ncbi:MAG: hypothetical protein NC489_32655, partial [Ruminococcus flavefaciens]|nr:hypothetical protein [Ruminococcus flavefaciens]